MKIIQSSLFCAFAVLVSCDKEKELESNKEEPIKEITWDWNKYVKSSELHLSSIPVDIQPKESFQILAESTGLMTFEVEGKNVNVQKDQVIARMDVDNLAEKTKRQEIALEQRAIEELKADTLEIPEKKKKAKEELEAAQLRLRRMKLLIRSNASKEIAVELFDGDFGNIDEEALKEAEEVVALAEKKYAFAQEYEEKLLKGERDIQDMDEKKSQRDLQQEKDRSVYKTPFTGELRLEVNYVEGQKEYNVNPREVVATVNDYSEIHAHLAVANAKWISLEPKRLYLQLSDPENTLVEFHDDRIEKDKRTFREERKYVFSIPLKDNKKLKRLTGTQMNAKLIYRLPEQCFIVPKYDVSLYALGKTDSLEWKVVVSKLWPNAKLLAEGHKYLAIKY